MSAALAAGKGWVQGKAVWEQDMRAAAAADAAPAASSLAAALAASFGLPDDVVMPPAPPAVPFSAFSTTSSCTSSTSAGALPSTLSVLDDRVSSESVCLYLHKSDFADVSNPMMPGYRVVQFRSKQKREG